MTAFLLIEVCTSILQVIDKSNAGENRVHNYPDIVVE